MRSKRARVPPCWPPGLPPDLELVVPNALVNCWSSGATRGSSSSPRSGRPSAPGARRSSDSPDQARMAGIGLDAGETVPVRGGFAVRPAARLCSLTAAEEVLVTREVVHLAMRVAGVRIIEHPAQGHHRSGIGRPRRARPLTFGVDGELGTARVRGGLAGEDPHRERWRRSIHPRHGAARRCGTGS